MSEVIDLLNIGISEVFVVVFFLSFMNLVNWTLEKIPLNKNHNMTLYFILIISAVYLLIN